MDSREHSAHISRFQALRENLAEVQRERNFRPVTNGKDGWILYEKLFMWGRVNAMRHHLFNKEPVDFERVEWVEQLACGHVDYTKKFALYCAELILE